MTEIVKLGIIGYGAEGGMYAGFFKNNDERLNDNIELAAVCDIDPAKKAKVAEDFPGLPFFDNYLDLLESGIVNAIVTTVPHYDHCVMGIAALERGIHLLGEKPAGVYTKDVERLIETSKKHPETTFAIFFNQRTNPLYRRVKQLMDEKRSATCSVLLGSSQLGGDRKATTIKAHGVQPGAEKAAAFL